MTCLHAAWATRKSGVTRALIQRTTLALVVHAAASDDVEANWVWVSLARFGLGAWIPIYAGVRAKRRLWWALGVVWTVIALAGWVTAIATHGAAASGLLIILGWAGAATTSFAIRSEYKEVLGSPLEAAVEGARKRLSDRDHARRLARRASRAGEGDRDRAARSAQRAGPRPGRCQQRVGMGAREAPGRRRFARRADRLGTRRDRRLLVGGGPRYRA